jgi:hypothetical protein
VHPRTKKYSYGVGARVCARVCARVRMCVRWCVRARAYPCALMCVCVRVLQCPLRASSPTCPASLCFGSPASFGCCDSSSVFAPSGHFSQLSSEAPAGTLNSHLRLQRANGSVVRFVLEICRKMVMIDLCCIEVPWMDGSATSHVQLYNCRFC